MTIFWIITALLVAFGFLLVRYPRTGLVVSLVVSALFFLFSWVEESILGICLSPVILLVSLVAVRCLRVARQVRFFARYALRWAIAMTVFIMLGALLYYTGGPWVALLLWFLVTWAASVAIYAATTRWSTSLQVFSLLGATMRQNLPLTVALENSATGRQDHLGAILWEIHAWLVQGYGLSEAIKRGYPQCPPDLLGMVVVAEKSGQLPQAFASLQQNEKAYSHWRSLTQADPGPYPFVILMILYFQAVGLFKFVIPQSKAVYTEMLGDMAQWPWPTRILMDARVGSITILQGLGFLLFAVLMVRVVRWQRPRRWRSRSLMDGLLWRMPWIGPLERAKGMLQVTTALRLALQGGATIDQAVLYTLDLDLNAILKKRLRRWHVAIVSGTAASVAAIQCRLGRSLAWAFEGDLNAGQTPAILASLEAFHRARHRYLTVVARSILNPCIIVVLGLIVAFVILAIFLPGVKVIQIMSDVYP